MDRLSKIARGATPQSGVRFRKDAYGTDGVAEFLRDVLALANASVEGHRYIVVGVDFDTNGARLSFPIDNNDFAGKPAYQALANEFIEPPIRLRYKPVSIEGTQVGVFEIGDCQDRPYMMRIDHSEKLRRGDAYTRIKQTIVKMGRRQLQELFERKFRDSVSAGDIEVGFPGDIIHKVLDVPTCDLSEMPSAQASMKLEQMLDIREGAAMSGATTTLVRLTHARLYGSDDPYVARSPAELVAELEQIRHKYADEDNFFLFEQQAQPVRVVVFHQGSEEIRDASLTLTLPNHESLYVATELPKRPDNGQFVERSPDEIAAYPSVSVRDKKFEVNCKIGNIPAGEPVEVLSMPLRVCVASELAGQRCRMNYALHAQNLRAPVSGQLKLKFR